LGFVGARILEAAGIFLAVASLLTTGYSTMAVCTATEAYRPAQHTKPQHGVGTGRAIGRAADAVAARATRRDLSRSTVTGRQRRPSTTLTATELV
jgi:hypothetical protein